MLNNISLIGRFTADPELKHTPTNIAVTSFTIAVNRAYVKQGAERETDFIDCVAWRNTAEFVSKYFHKGQQVAIEGKLQTRMFTDKEGKNRKAVEVLVTNAYFCESKKADVNVEKAPEEQEEMFEPIDYEDEDIPF